MQVFINELFKPGTYEAVVLKRQDLLREPGTQEKYVYLVKEGALRAVFYQDDQLLTVRLAYQDNLITGLDAFLAQDSGKISWQAIKKTTLWRIPRTVVDTLLESNPVFLRKWCQMLEQLVLAQIHREIDILIEPPIERYQRVLSRSPQLFQEIPLKYIAAYLRMAPETLSRLRNS